MAAVQPGDYITARCGRCDDITGHVVMIVVGGEILRVECKACGSVHKYRSQKPTVKKRETSGFKHVKAGQNRDQALEKGQKSPMAGTGAPTAKPAPRNRPKHGAAWQEAVFDLSGQVPLEYSMSMSFPVQSLILHPVFGKGVVLAVHKPNKMDVLFEEGVKTLLCKA